MLHKQAYPFEPKRWQTPFPLHGDGVHGSSFKKFFLHHKSIVLLNNYCFLPISHIAPVYPLAHTHWNPIYPSGSIDWPGDKLSHIPPFKQKSAPLFFNCSHVSGDESF